MMSPLFNKEINDKMSDLLTFEKEQLALGNLLICGVDEVGRGPLAGPVVVTAIIMDLNNIVDGVDDSKKVSQKKREKLYPLILQNSIAHKTICIDNNTIDQINILQATKLAMNRAISEIIVKPDIVFIDAVKLELDIPTISIIHGDALSYSIAAASIVAKVERDAMMVEYSKIYPQYGFESNKGYGSAKHIQAIKDFGECIIHRQSFIKNFK